MKLYSIVSREVRVSDSRKIISYGILYRDCESAFTVEDIASDNKRLKRLVDSCNELELEASQIRDIVEDFLAEQRSRPHETNRLSPMLSILL